MPLSEDSPDPKSVFLNVPFDRAYRPKFVALIAGLTALGRTPRCVLEVETAGASRLEREARINSPFHRHLFVLTARAAGRLAREEGFIE